MTTDRWSLTARGFFVTGTDTGVGKTLVACALLQACAMRGMRAIGMKPVAAGAHLENGRLVNDDVKALQGAANVAAPAELVNPYCFGPAVAPHIAAAQAGTGVELERIVGAFRRLSALADCVVVEGAGGFRVPLNARNDMRDLAVELGLPVVLVVGMRLGCLSHALLSADAVSACGLRLAGWVANHVDEAMACADENVTALAERLPAPCLARVAHRQNRDPSRLARELRIALLD